MHTLASVQVAGGSTCLVAEFFFCRIHTAPAAMLDALEGGCGMRGSKASAGRPVLWTGAFDPVGVGPGGARQS